MVGYLPQKIHLNSLRDVCVQYDRNLPWVSEICSETKLYQISGIIKLIMGDGMVDGRPFK